VNTSVIVIDDDPDTREVLSEFFRLRSIDVLATGNNGKEAIELYKEYSPDVVVMDFLMPDFDGLYGLENIHKLDSNAKVVILSGSMDYDLQKKMTELRVYAIMQKPCDVNNLVEVINTVSSVDAAQLNN